MSIVLDASVFEATCATAGPVGNRAESLLDGRPPYAPELMLVEAMNVIRRLERIEALDGRTADDCFETLQVLRVQTYSSRPLLDRAWHLRNNVSGFDALYVALAEEFGVPLATADVRLTRASGPRCEFLIPPVP